MSTKLANFITYLCFPGLMPTYLLATLYFVCPYIVSMDGYATGSKSLLLLFIFLYTFVFPGILIFWLFKQKKITDIKLSNLKDRRLPYLITIISTGFLAYFFFQKSILLKPSGIILSYIVCVLILLAILSLKWQVSAHAAGIGGVLGAFFMLQYKYSEPSLLLPFYISLLLCGLVISARLKLNAHTPAQVVVGLMIGLFFSTFASLLI